MFKRLGQDTYSTANLGSIHGEGNFERQGTSITMIDNPTVETSPRQISFHLDGDYHYSQIVNKIIIEGKNGMGFIRIMLD
jgi:hypothetical protein